MTAQPKIIADVEEWRGQWINFYSYRGGQQHLGQIISASREASDEVRAAWFRQAADEYYKHALILAFHLPAREAFWVPVIFDRFKDTDPIVAKVKNCTFSLAIPYTPTERPQDEISF